MPKQVIKHNKTLTRKQQAFVEHLVNHPKESATQAAKHAYKTATNHTAEQIAYENMRKPEIVTELAKYNNLVENTLVNTVNDWGREENTRKREIAVDTAKYIHDKVNGKATQRTEVKTQGVTLNIDLTSAINPET